LKSKLKLVRENLWMFILEFLFEKIKQRVECTTFWNINQVGVQFVKDDDFIKALASSSSAPP